MQYIYRLLLLLMLTTNSCQNSTPKKINLEDIQDSSNRAYPIQEESEIVFYNTENQVISSDKFNQFLAEGLYLSEPKTNLYGEEEIHLVSLVNYTKHFENKVIPEFEFKDLNGKNYNLNSLKGKVTVLSFWFTASSICIQEIQEINTLQLQQSSMDCSCSR